MDIEKWNLGMGIPSRQTQTPERRHRRRVSFKFGQEMSDGYKVKHRERILNHLIKNIKTLHKIAAKADSEARKLLFFVKAITEK